MTALSRHARVSVASTLAAVLVISGLTARVLVRQTDMADRMLDSARAEYALLASLREARGSIQEAQAVVTAAIDRHALPAGVDDNRAAAELQSMLRARADASGLILAGSQIQPLRSHDGFDEIPVSLTLHGSLEQTLRMLHSLRADSPSVLIDTLVMYPVRRADAKAGQQLVVQVTVTAMRPHP